MMIDTLERRMMLAADGPWRSVNSQIDAAAGGDMKVFDSLVDEGTGRTYLVGLVRQQVTVVALGANGKVDTRFGGGSVKLPSERRYHDGALFERDRPAMLATDADGHVFVATGTEVTKFQTNGKRDLTFGRRGVQDFASEDLGLRIQDALPTTDGRVLVVTRIQRNTREVFSTFEITDTSSRPFFSVRNDTGLAQETLANRGRQDAYWLEGAGAFWLVWRSSDIELQGDIINRVNNQARLLRFSPRLKNADGGSIYLPPTSDITDVRLIKGATAVEATTNAEVVRLNPDTGAGSRWVHTNDSSIRALETRFAPNNTLWQAYDVLADGKDEIYFEQIPRTGFRTDPDVQRVHLADNFGDEGLFNTFHVTEDDTLILTTGVPSQGLSMTRHIRPGLDGPRITQQTLQYYGHVPYQNIRYDAPYGISKSSVDWVRGPFDDLIITAPSAEELVSGTSGHQTAGTSYWARYWINGPGGSWGTEDNGVYTVEWRPGSVSDGLGVLNSDAFSYQFDYDYNLSYYG